MQDDEKLPKLTNPEIATLKDKLLSERRAANPDDNVYWTRCAVRGWGFVAVPKSKSELRRDAYEKLLREKGERNDP